MVKSDGEDEGEEEVVEEDILKFSKNIMVLLDETSNQVKKIEQ